MHPRTIRLAHSGDMDDAFMVDGILTGAVDLRGIVIERVEGDIESLNRRALAGELEVTAVSFAAWPWIADRYDLSPIGSSFGLGHGPKLVSRRPMTDGEVLGRVIAVPGAMTSAAVLLALRYPGIVTRPHPFDDIPRAVADGELDAGVVIHEAQLSHGRLGLVASCDLGAWWAEDTGGLPAPLGANAIRRDLDARLRRDLLAVLRESIQHALANRPAAVRRALAWGKGLTEAEGDRYVGMYVNALTLDPGERGRESVERFLRRAHFAGLLPRAEPRWA